MTGTVHSKPEGRLLVLAATSKDAALTQSILSRAGVDCVCCTNLEQICTELKAGASAVLLVEEAVTAHHGNCLIEWLARQGPWSDLPVLVLARPGADSAAVAQAMDLLGNVTVLERPTRVAALVSAVRSAMRARQRQYEARAHLAQIERSERDLSDFFDNASVGLHWVGPDGTILRVNQTELDMLGYAREEYVGRHIAEFHANLPVIHDILARLTRGETLRDFPARMRAKDGSVRDVVINSNVLFEDGVFVHTRCFTRDVTEHKRAEQALRESDERFRLAQSVSRIGTFEWNIQTGVNVWTPELEAIYGLAPGEFAKTQATWEALVHPDDRADATTMVNVALQTGEPTESEWRVVWPDGSVHWVAGRFKCFKDSAGKPLRLSGINIDITELKRAEQELKDADRRKDEFLAMLAHELRNPLAPIRNSLHILRMNGQHDPAAERVGAMMERQVNHMVRLVDDLLDVSRITRGKIELRKEPLEVAAILRGAVETSQPYIDEAGHQLAVAIPPEPLTLEGDPVRLTQVVANLLNNAAKYTDPGGQIWLTVRREDHEVAISVRDTGMGISPEMLPRVFELFTQIDRKTNRGQGGLGIGLTLVKRLVEMHSGSIQAHSEGPGKGSEFVVRLPLSATPWAPARSGKEAKSSAPLSSRRVLVVDDNRDAAQSLGMLLKLLGAEVQVVCSGADAIAALTTFEPSVVLLDIGMPGMDGYEVARRIRQEPKHRHVTLIALTGWGQEEDRRRSRDAGFDYHLIKPAELTALETLLISLEERQP